MVGSNLRRQLFSPDATDLKYLPTEGRHGLVLPGRQATALSDGLAAGAEDVRGPATAAADGPPNGIVEAIKQR